MDPPILLGLLHLWLLLDYLLWNQGLRVVLPIVDRLTPHLGVPWIDQGLEVARLLYVLLDGIHHLGIGDHLVEVHQLRHLLGATLLVLSSRLSNHAVLALFDVGR